MLMQRVKVKLHLLKINMLQPSDGMIHMVGCKKETKYYRNYARNNHKLLKHFVAKLQSALCITTKSANMH